MESEYNPEELINRYAKGACNAHERAIVESWHLHDLSQSTFVPQEENISGVHEQMRKDIIGYAQRSRQIRHLWIRAAAAATIALFISIGIYVHFHELPVRQTYASDLAPGTADPVLTLSGKRKITLNEKNHTTAQQKDIIIKHGSSGQLVYVAANATDAVHQNTLSNPRGSKVLTLLLTDGTEVKLEAGSSITYPSAFTGKERKVTTTGKVYFHVTHNREKPFFAVSKGQVTEDLGTQFIVDAYDDETAVKTTLIEGSVKVHQADQSTLLKPGEQAVFRDHDRLLVNTADMGKETAWLNGDFNFKNEELGNIMRQLSRVYDIERVTYKGDTQHLLFYGMISRSRNLSAVLMLMESTGKIHFEMQERRIVVIAGAR